ncbi:MAG: 3-deoxy-8-phosphooctulonate synthase [Rickettsiales bacterium]
MVKNRKIKISDFEIANDLPLALIAGPCQIESLDHSLYMAESLTKICNKLGINFIYKSSYDKANRSSYSSQRGVGLENALPIFKRIKTEFGCPIVTDVHNEEQCAIIADYVDVIQIPAFLCRQTDLLQAAAKTGKVLNIKKGQFLSPYDAKNIVDKVDHFGNHNVALTERGVSFGYNTLVSDMRSLEIMAETTGAPIIFDATHSVQQPGGLGKTSGGDRRFAKTLARAAVAVGVAAVFMETHQDPDNAPSDGPNMIRLEEMESLVGKLIEFDKLAKSI